jgi:recombination protein RecT
MPEPSTEVATKGPTTLRSLLIDASTKKRFEEILKDRAPGFISSILSLYTANQQLQEADPRSILQSAIIAATLDLPINQNLGFAFIVPYGKQAQFQMGAKGFIQLAIRTGQYKTIHATEVYKDEIKLWDPLTGTFTSTDNSQHKMRSVGKQEDIAGYMAFFRLVNGFEKTSYMTVDQIKAHAKKYSKSYENPRGQWQVNPHAMSLKTVLKLVLSKYGLLSIQMERAIEVDQAVVETTGELNYVDRAADEEVPVKPMNADKKINEDQFKLLCARASVAGIDIEEVGLYIKTTFKKEHKHDLTIEELTKVLKWLQQEPTGE